MGTTHKSRAGSLQYWPRKRAKKFLHSVNWKILEEQNSDAKILGFIVYKTGMTSVLVKDLTPDSLTKNKKITIPATILEAPAMKILSARFYKNNNAVGEVMSANLDKELKKRIKLPKQIKRKIEDIKDYDDIRILVYSIAKSTDIKKVPDIAEIGLTGGVEEKLNFVKQNLEKDIVVSDFFKPLQLVDIRGLTKGSGFSGAVKRFGITLKAHKSEKGRRRPGSLGPWHPHYVTFRVPMAGQYGMFSRIQNNSKIIAIGKIKENDINPEYGFHKYGKIRTNYILLGGSIPGSKKRQVLITFPLRKTKKQQKKNYELIKILR